MQEIHLELDHLDFYCPVTGKHILSEEDSESSPATAFIYIDDIGEFSGIRPDLLKLYEEKCDFYPENDEDEDDLNPIDRFMKLLKDTPNLVVFNITTSGVACGPVSNTVRVGIDMNYCPSDA